jgi:uncharacterized damage-inducible protein DinB
MLIVSGLAGTPTNNSLTKKERRFALEHMKETKTNLLNAIKDLNETQLIYRSAPDKWSVSECIFHLAASEKGLLQLFETTMNSPVNPEKRSEIKMTDEELINKIQDRSFKSKTLASLEPKNIEYKSLENALSDFKEKRNNHIKYLKNSTEDLRNHIVETPLGWLDSYQITLLISSHSYRLNQQIFELRSMPGFPH